MLAESSDEIALADGASAVETESLSVTEGHEIDASPDGPEVDNQAAEETSTTSQLWSVFDTARNTVFSKIASTDAEEIGETNAESSANASASADSVAERSSGNGAPAPVDEMRRQKLSSGITLGPSTSGQLFNAGGQWFNAVSPWRDVKKDSTEVDAAVDGANESDFTKVDSANVDAEDAVSRENSVLEGSLVQASKMWSNISITSAPEVIGNDDAVGATVPNDSSSSHIAAIGQSIYSSGGQLLSTVQAWREPTKAEDAEDDVLVVKAVPRKESEEPNTDDTVVATSSPSSHADDTSAAVATADSPAGSSIAAIGQSIYDSGGQLLSTVQAWREPPKKAEDAEDDILVVKAASRKESEEPNTDDTVVAASSPSCNADDTSAAVATADSPAGSGDLQEAVTGPSLFVAPGQLLEAVRAWGDPSKEAKDSVVTDATDEKTPQPCSVLEADHDGIDTATASKGPHVDLLSQDATADEIRVEPGINVASQDAAARNNGQGKVELAAIPEADDTGISLTKSSRRVSGGWCMLEADMVTCWRCGALISASIEAIEQHSHVCTRPARAESMRNLDELHKQVSSAQQQEFDKEAEIVDVANSSPAAGSWGDSSGISPSGMISKAAGGAVSAAVRFKNLGSHYKDKACSYLYETKLPKDGLVHIQTAHTGLFLNSCGFCVAAGSSVGLRSDCATDEGQWLLVQTSTEGVYVIKSIETGRCLSVGCDEGGRGTPYRVGLSRGEVTPREEWRIAKVTSGCFSVQSVYNGFFMAARIDGVVDGAEVEAAESVVSSDCEWRFGGIDLERTDSTDANHPAVKPSLIESLTPDMTTLEIYSRIEATMERSILLVLDPVIHGIPTLGIPPVRIEAQSLIKEHGSAQAVIADLQCKAEQAAENPGLPQKAVEKASELLVLRFLPFLGAGAYLSYILYSRLHLAALVAELHGQDTEDPEIQSMLLFCIAPDAGPNADSEHPEDPDKGLDEKGSGNSSGLKTVVARSARAIAHVSARQVLARGTGWKTAADLYDLAAAMISEKYMKVEDSESVESADQATLRRAQLLFEPALHKTATRGALVVLCIGAALPTAASLLRHVLRIMLPIFGVQVFLAIVVCVLSTLGLFVAIRHEQLLDMAYDFSYERPEVIATVIFIFHASLPLLAAFDASTMLVNGLERDILSSGEDEKHGSGLLLLLLGIWAWLRLLQRCSAEPDSPCARGEATRAQRLLIAVVILIGTFDVLGPDGLGHHTGWRFGVLKTHHWGFGLLKAQALECQMKLLTLLRNRDNLLRILGATRMMSLAFVLFLGGVTASVGFLVSRSEFSKFVDSLAPPPQAMTVILALTRSQAVDALVLGAGAGFLWQVPSYFLFAMLTRLLGVAVGAFAVWKVAAAFEQHRETLLDPAGGRFLLLLPETSERSRIQAQQAWSEFSEKVTTEAVTGATTRIGTSVVSGALDYAASWWTRAGATGAVEAAVEAVEAVESH